MQPREQTNSDIENYLAAIDAADDELATLKGSYMQSCKGPRAQIREIMGEAREAGENMRAFRVLLKGHRAERAQQKRIAALEQDDATAFEDLRARLGDFGDTPLGAAALDGAKARGARRSGEESLDTLGD